MKTITFTAKAEYPKDSILSFAESKGYTKEEGQTPEEFVNVFIKESLIKILIEPTINSIKKQKNIEADTIIEKTKEAINNSVSLSYE